LKLKKTDSFPAILYPLNRGRRNHQIALSDRPGSFYDEGAGEESAVRSPGVPHSRSPNAGAPLVRRGRREGRAAATECAEPRQSSGPGSGCAQNNSETRGAYPLPSARGTRFVSASVGTRMTLSTSLFLTNPSSWRGCAATTEVWSGFLAPIRSTSRGRALDDCSPHARHREAVRPWRTIGAIHRESGPAQSGRPARRATSTWIATLALLPPRNDE